MSVFSVRLQLSFVTEYLYFARPCQSDSPACPLISMWIAQVLSSDGDTESSTYCRAVMFFSSLSLSCFLSGLLGVCDRSFSLFSLLTSVLLPESHLFVREASGVALHRRKSQMKISIFLEFFFFFSKHK